MIFRFSKERRREGLRAQLVPAAWHSILARNVPIFHKLPPKDRIELMGHVRVFLAEKNFEGCGGLELTDEIRVTIAAQACLLLLHRKTDYYPQLTSILVYPSGYTVPGERYLGGHVWEEGGEDLLGHTERHMRSLVLAWDAAKLGGANRSDGQNLVLHEFAHQLDFEDYGHRWRAGSGHAKRVPRLGAGDEKGIRSVARRRGGGPPNGARYLWRHEPG